MAKAKNSKFMAPVKVSSELAVIVGKGPMPRTEVTKKLWAYIKKHKCQDTKIKETSSLMKLYQKFSAKRQSTCSK